MRIENKEDIINHFIEGNKEQSFIGVENEKFIYDKKTNKRCNYAQIKDVLNFLHDKYNWKKIEEQKNIIGLIHYDKQVTLEPGNQIELAGSK